MSTSPSRAAPPAAVIGDGAIGRALAAALRRIHPQTLLTSRKDGPFHLDLAAPDVRALPLGGCRQAVITAGITKMAACEAGPEATRLVNVQGTLALAAELARAGITVVWLSSDQVFGGREAPYADVEAFDPVNEYGRQKAEVERALPEICGGDCLILRLGKVYGATPGDGSLLDEMLRELTSGREIRAARDLVFTLVRLDDLTAAILELLALGVTGTFNLCAPGAASRLDIAHACARALGVPDSLVRSIAVDELGEKFTRPKRVELLPNRAAGLISRTFVPITRSVAELAAAYRAEANHG